ncbi:MAG: hypothetical protein A2Y20_03340 [Firmicutes bacterium GWF2_51_9]|nr:MAG: hypothetical protein A2Y20_03340 [Firmicutes bacterium GWF2_51_9]OGS57830.1 MAG: hypothetical protein A2Y19_10140 [Firmicutes bacterium GWE2_51_13]HBZ41390.1 hypothetical protein [Erysipelotrichaceae bacterium]
MRNPDRIPLNVEAYQKVEAAILPTRQSACVYYILEIQSESLVRYLREHRLRFFSYVLYVCKETVLRFPFLNDFMLGGKKFRHTTMSVSTVMKKDVSKEGSISLVKIELEEKQTASEIQEKMDHRISTVRGEKEKGFKKLIQTLDRFPMPLFRIGLSLASFVDRLGLLPASLIHADPLHTSLVIANLGSVDGDAVFHHLYEWGTSSLFITLGRLDEQGKVTITFTIDERISEGQQLFKALAFFKDCLENPR